jgi:hypothetical protein
MNCSLSLSNQGFVGVAWRLLGVENLVASRPPLEVGAASLETASTWVVGTRSSRPPILGDFEDLNHCCLEHGGGLGELGSLLEPAELIHGHDEIGTRGQLDLVFVDLHELIIEIAGNAAAPLLVGVTTCNGYATTGCCDIAFYCTTSGMVGVLVFLSNTLGIGFIISRGLS